MDIKCHEKDRSHYEKKNGVLLCNHCCFCCGHPFTILDVSLFISYKNKIQCVCVSCEQKKKKKNGVLLRVTIAVIQINPNIFECKQNQSFCVVYINS